MNPNAIGEASIPQQTQQQVAPDVTSQQGQQQLLQKAIEANKAKPLLDAILAKITAKVGGEANTRVKQIETMSAKIAQKRLQGRDYSLDDVGDALGGRIVVKNNQQISAAKKEVVALGKQGLFTITKAEPVKTNDYKAFHYDIMLPTGLKTELQIHDQHSVASAVVNHDLRAVHGESPANDAVSLLRDKQAAMIKGMPGEKALAISKTIEAMRKQNGGKPIDPRTTAGIIQQA